MSLANELSTLLNQHSRENESNTPDFIVSTYMLKCLQAFEDASIARERWYGEHRRPGGQRVAATHYANGMPTKEARQSESCGDE